MALPKPPPPIDIPPETKRAILAGFKKIVEVFQAHGKIEAGISYTDILHTPGLLSVFISAFRASPGLYADVVVDGNGRPVVEPDRPLVCGVSLAQVQQLMVKTCARHLFLQEDEEKTVTRTVTTTRFLIFKETTQIKQRLRSKDPGVLREVLRFVAFDWQLPLLADYAELSLQQLAEVGGDILALRTPEAVREFQKIDYLNIRKAKALTGPDFPLLLEARPGAIKGVLYWQKDMYPFLRALLGPRFFEFMVRDDTYYMMVATMEKPMLRLYGDVLAYISKDNLIEMQRLNLDKAEIMLTTLKAVFGPKMEQLLSLPNFAREILRRQVEGLVHMRGDKDHMADIHSVTWSAAAPQVLQWLAKQSKAA